MKSNYTVGVADFTEQGKLGTLLLEICGPVWERECASAAAAGQNSPAYTDELLAADDFYFSNAELMNCCWFARAEPGIIGAACVNPYTSVLHFLVVRPEWRRHGVGRRLLQAAESTVKRYGAKSLRIDFSEAEEFAGADTFFQQCGYKEIKRQRVYAAALC